MHHLNDEMRYRLLKRLEEAPNVSQRELAEALDSSLDKAKTAAHLLSPISAPTPASRRRRASSRRPASR